MKNKGKFKFKNKQTKEQQDHHHHDHKTEKTKNEKTKNKNEQFFLTHSFQINKPEINEIIQRQPLSVRQNREFLSQSLKEFDYRNKQDFVEIKDFLQNPQEQTINSARNKSQDETSQNDGTKSTPRSALNQSILNCLICYDKSPDAVLMDCGHGGK